MNVKKLLDVKNWEIGFLAFLSMVSSITTYLGLREYLQQGVLASGALSEFLSLSLGLMVFASILYFWTRLTDQVRQGQFSALGMALIFWLPLLFCMSTWWSTVGISGGSAMRLELARSIKIWQEDMDSYFHTAFESLDGKIAEVDSSAATAASLSQAEAENGVMSGAGTSCGPVCRCWAQLATGLEGIGKQIRDQRQGLVIAHTESLKLLGGLREGMRSDKGVKTLVGEFINTGSAIQANLARVTMTDIDQTIAHSLSLAECHVDPNQRLNDGQRLAIADLKSRIEKLKQPTGAKTSLQGKFVLPAVPSIHMAVFYQWREIIPGWGVAIANDFLPLLLLLFAFFEFRRNEKRREGLELDLEDLEDKIRMAETMLGKKDTELAILEQRLAEIKAKVVAGEKDPVELLIQISSLQSHINELENFHKNACDELAKTTEQLTGTANLLTQWRAQAETLGAEKERLLNDKVIADARIEGLEKQLQRLQQTKTQDVSALRNQVAQLETEVAKLTAQLSTSVTTTQKQANDLANRKEEIQSLQQANAELRRLNMRLRAQMARLTSAISNPSHHNGEDDDGQAVVLGAITDLDPAGPALGGGDGGNQA